jgi:hypothetical protein
MISNAIIQLWGQWLAPWEVGICSALRIVVLLKEILCPPRYLHYICFTLILSLRIGEGHRLRVVHYLLGIGHVFAPDPCLSVDRQAGDFPLRLFQGFRSDHEVSVKNVEHTHVTV